MNYKFYGDGVHDDIFAGGGTVKQNILYNVIKFK